MCACYMTGRMLGFVDTMINEMDCSLMKERNFNQIVTKEIIRLQLIEVPQETEKILRKSL